MSVGKSPTLFRLFFVFFFGLGNVAKSTDHGGYSRQFDEHILKVTLLKSNLLLISSEQIMLLLKNFTAFFFNSCETIHVMNILEGGRSYLEPKGQLLPLRFQIRSSSLEDIHDMNCLTCQVFLLLLLLL